MAKYTGNSMELTYAGTTITANLLRSVTINESGEVFESTGAGDTNKTYLTGKIDGTVQIEAWDDSTTSTIFDVFAPNTSDTLDFYPQGNSSGKPKRSMTAIVTARNRGVEHNGVVPVSISLQISGAITDSTVV